MKQRKGYTLVEVVIAILLTSVMVSAAFTIALTGKQSGPRLDRRMLATQAANSVAQKLRNYITSDVNNAQIAGPNGGAPGAASWQIGGIYALSEGGPRALPAAYLPPEIASMPGAQITYTVNWRPSAAACPMPPGVPTALPGDCYPSIIVSVDWNE